MDLFTRSRPPEPPLPGRDYLLLLHKYLQTNFSRLAPTAAPPSATFLQQSYTLLTLGLDPSSQPLSRAVKVPLTLGFADAGKPPAAPTSKTPIRPLSLRLPPDRLLYLLLRWQALPHDLAHVGRTDVPIAEGVPFAARGATERDRDGGGRKGQVDGDVQSVRSWAGSMRSVSLGSMSMGVGSLGRGWWAKEEPSEDQILLALYRIFIVLPALLIHPPFFSDRPIAELIEAGGYTQLGGVDVRVPLDVLRNLQVLELEAYDPRALLIPVNTNLRSLTVRDVQDGDDWVEELLAVPPPTSPTSVSSVSTSNNAPSDTPRPRFPSLRHLSLPSTSLLSFPSLPLTTLVSLDLSHNLLNSIPSSLSSLSSLRSLNLSYNLITSVRNAPSSLGNISTLNISHNRIDCLLGLDRVLGLERVDVRFNELMEVGEVGRLAVLPTIKEVWSAGNEFSSPNAGVALGGGGVEWRVELGAAFVQEGNEMVVFDDTPLTWNEKRSIDALLQSRGQRRPANNRTPTAPIQHRAVAERGSHANGSSGSGASARMGNGRITESGSNEKRSTTSSRSDKDVGSGGITNQAEAGPSRARYPTLGVGHNSLRAGSTSTPTSHGGPGPNLSASSNGLAFTAAPSPTPSAAASAISSKKRRPRRLINLDSTTDPADLRVRGGGGSIRLPPKTVLYEEEQDQDQERAVGVDKENDRPGRRGGGGDADEGKGERDEEGRKGEREEDGMGGAGEGIVKVRKSRRARVSASMFEPS